MSPDIIDATNVIWFGPQHVSAHGWAAKLTNATPMQVISIDPRKNVQSSETSDKDQ